MELEFYKAHSQWYVDLPTWEGSIDDLEMVCGADDFLEALSYKLGRDRVKLEVWEQAPGMPVGRLSKIGQDSAGATYEVYDCEFYEGEAWLCNVTRFVFDGYHPDTIYFRVEE